ncbi:hypothetical protein ILT06_18675 [Bacillus sp. 17RED48]|uniref:hypothetical protein n=1 Tax=unclassified Bacillus (in: firmicutes) TaxID=185979 RepID=UPI001C9AA06E|nr:MULTISPECIES: hypothetical protein [unclassified Bacillus (in: firmicutes)]MBY7112900.1 hypothetical protein [Bacillus sp. 17RED48]MBY7124182.1 hypothetical protein [Bacillus sp. 16GRE42]
MEENNNNLGKKVAISVMSVALLGTSGYLVYDKGFKTAGKEQVKLASNTEEKKDDRITGGDLQSMFPNLVADPAKKDEKPGEKPTINLADLIGNNKSPITPVTYKPDEVSVEKKDPQIKLSDAPTPQKLDLPTNMGGPVVEPSKNFPDSLVDPGKTSGGDKELEKPKPDGDKEPEKPKPDGDKEPEKPKPDGDKEPEKPKPDGDKEPEKPKPDGDKEPEKPKPDGDKEPEKPKPDGDKEPEKPKPPVPHDQITVSPITGDILVEWYAGNGEKYSSVFFNEYYGKEQDSNKLDMLAEYSEELKDLTLISQLNKESNAKTLANHRLTLENLGEILANKDNHSNQSALFYLRNQMNTLKEKVTTQQELQKYLNENQKEYIQFVGKLTYDKAVYEEGIWLEDPYNPENLVYLEQALSKYYLVTSVLESVDPKIVESANQRVEKIFYKLLEEELKNINIDKPVVTSNNDTKENVGTEEALVTSSNGEKAVKEDNKVEIEASEIASEKDKKDQLIESEKSNIENKEKIEHKNKDSKDTVDQMKPEKSEKEKRIDQAIEQIETYLNSENPQYEKTLILVNESIADANNQQKEKLDQQFSMAVEGLQGQINAPTTSVEVALNKANLLANTAKVEKSVQDEAKKLLMPLMFERKAIEAANMGEYYTAVLNIANAIRTKHPLERSREEMVNYSNKLWVKTENEWNEMNGTTGWQNKVEKTVLPSYTLLAQLKDIDKTIGQINGMGMIDSASRKMEGIQLIQIASAKANEPGKLFDALHYFGQASNRGVDDEKGFTKVANEVLYAAEQAEKSNYLSALEIYQILYKTPGIELTGMKDKAKAAIEYLSAFDAANKRANHVSTIEDLASVIELTHQSIMLGYQQEPVNKFMKAVSEEMLETGEKYLKKNDSNNAYKCFEFLTRPIYSATIDGELRQKAMKQLNEIKAINVQK